MPRPLANIDPKAVYEMAADGCKTKEIADSFGVSEDTITNRFSVELAKGRADIRISLRRWQLKAARNGNVVMQIWLGKQMLGQKDKSDEEIAAENASTSDEVAKILQDCIAIERERVSSK